MTRTTLIENILLRAKQVYYHTGTTIITDPEYDALETELRKLRPDSKILKMVGAPVAASDHAKIAHRIPMGSQSKVNTAEEFRAWVKKLNAEKLQLHISVKADGCSISANYEDGILQSAVTRGDGLTGEDVTSNALMFSGLPHTISLKGKVSVRGEAVLTVADWAKVDPEKTKNPRNVGNGIVARRDGTNAHLIRFLAFDISADKYEFAAETQKDAALRQLGFTVIPHWVGNPDQIEAAHASVESAFTDESTDYWADGTVVKIDDVGVQELWGVKDGCPVAQIAWKFENEEAVTRLLNIDWRVGHTGKIIPVGVLAPVELGGTTVTSVMLNNPAQIAAQGLRSQAAVRIAKANGIIPVCLGLAPTSDASDGVEFAPPHTCPSCGSTLQSKDGVGGKSVDLYCVAETCPAQSIGKIRRWINSQNILGIGDTLLEALVESDLVAEIQDLYLLAERANKLARLPMGNGVVGASRARSIIAEVEKTRAQSLPQFIGSFGIIGLGVRKAQLMMEANPDLADLTRWLDGSLSRPDFAQKSGVPGVGKSMSVQLLARTDEIVGVRELVQIKKPVTAAQNGTPQTSETPKKVCITGTLPSGKKKAEYKAPLTAHGFELVDDVTKDLTYLVVANPAVPSNKQTKAAKLGVKVISENELVLLIK